MGSFAETTNTEREDWVQIIRVRLKLGRKQIADLQKEKSH